MGVCSENDEIISEMCSLGCTNKEIADRIGASVESVKTYCKHSKYHILYRTKRDAEVLDLLNKAYPFEKISEAQNVSVDMVKRIAKQHGISVIDYGIDKKRVEALIAERKPYDEMAREIGCTTEKIKGFCKRYGLRTETKTLSQERKGRIISDLFSGISVKETAEKHNVSVPMVYKCVGSIQKTRSPHICPSCGRLTTRPVWCSAECLRKETIKRDHATRRARIRGATVDRNITLAALVERDNGICYLCGKRVNEEDYSIRDKAFMCGNWYPSIDHVIPLSKGGKHSWENVRLAHRICNSVKGDETHGFGNMEKENYKADERLRRV